MSDALTTTGFDYSAIGPLGDTLAQIAETIRGKMKLTAQNVIDIGIELTSAKGILRGEFIVWVEEELKTLKADTAQRWMRAAKRFADKPQIAATFAGCLSVLYMLANPDVSDAAIKEVVRVAERDGGVTIADAKEIVKTIDEFDEPREPDNDEEAPLEPEESGGDKPESSYIESGEHDSRARREADPVAGRKSTESEVDRKARWHLHELRVAVNATYDDCGDFMNVADELDSELEKLIKKAGEA